MPSGVGPPGGASSVLHTVGVNADFSAGNQQKPKVGGGVAFWDQGSCWWESHPGCVKWGREGAEKGHTGFLFPTSSLEALLRVT